MTRLADIRVRHEPWADPDGGPVICPRDGAIWPCDAVQLLATIDTLTGALRGLVTAQDAMSRERSLPEVTEDEEWQAGTHWSALEVVACELDLKYAWATARAALAQVDGGSEPNEYDATILHGYPSHLPEPGEER